MLSPEISTAKNKKMLCQASFFRVILLLNFDEKLTSFQLLAEEFGGAPIMVPRTVRTLSSLLEYLPMDGSLSGSLALVKLKL